MISVASTAILWLVLTPQGLLELANPNKKDLHDFFKNLDSFRLPKSSVKGLKGGLAFFEPSTRTKVSFESAGQDLGIQWIDLSPEALSLKKGESFRDTFDNLNLYDIDFWVVRSSLTGLPHSVAKWTQKPVFNAGDGMNQHPTQALADAYTLHRNFGSKKLKISFFGDVYRSRVARSDLAVLRALGHDLSVCDDESNETKMFSEAFKLKRIKRSALKSQDLVICLRIQSERGSAKLQEPLGLSDLSEKTYVMHPGPVIWGQDLLLEISQLEKRNLILQQARSGFEVRRKLMADLRRPT